MAVEKRRGLSFAITLVGWLIILTSFGHMNSLSLSSKYWQQFDFLPASFIVIRYAGSWIQRVVGLLSGIGIIFRNEFSRRTMIVLSLYNIVTAYWKHPLIVFQRQAAVWDIEWPHFFAQYGMPQMTFGRLAVPVAVMGVVYEWACFGFLLYFLTRPAVKSEFRHLAKG